MKLSELINGTLLGDATVRVDKNKYYYYSLNAKDKNFLKWFGKLFLKFNIPTYIVLNNAISKVFALGFYINARQDSNLSALRNKWYTKQNGKTQKSIPKDLELTPMTLLHWYLGDGCLVRRKEDENRIPTIVLATNCFSKEDISFLIQKLKELNLNFYPVEYTSGFTGNKCGYCLYSKVQDGTPFRFFKFIGLECPKEISDFSTGRKGIYREEHFFKNKWPTEEDWIKILSNEKWIGKVIKDKREKLGIKRDQITGFLNVNKDYVRKVEYGRRNPSVDKFRKVLNTLKISTSDVLNSY